MKNSTNLYTKLEVINNSLCVCCLQSIKRLWLIHRCINPMGLRFVRANSFERTSSANVTIIRVVSCLCWISSSFLYHALFPRGSLIFARCDFFIFKSSYSSFDWLSPDSTLKVWWKLEVINNSLYHNNNLKTYFYHDFQLLLYML